MRLLLFHLVAWICFHAAFGSDALGIAAMQWKIHTNLPPLPGKDYQPGLAGSFAGVINNRLIIAGGANFPDKPPWEGLLLIGGINENACHRDVFLLQLSEKGDQVRLTEWPSLPVPLSNMTGMLVDNIIYIAGGQVDSEKPSAGNQFLALDLRNREDGWKTLSPWPGPPRSFAVSASQSDGFDNCFYLFSGRNYGPDRPVEVLSDGYEYNPRLDKCRRLDSPDGPKFPVMAGTAFASGTNHIIFTGGDDGRFMYKQRDLQEKLARLVSIGSGQHTEDSIQLIKDQINHNLSNHPGFSRDVLFYHTVTNTIVKGGEVPLEVPVTTNIIKYGNRVIIPGGETRPGVRTASIITGEIVTARKGFGTLNYLGFFQKTEKHQ